MRREKKWNRVQKRWGEGNKYGIGRGNNIWNRVQKRWGEEKIYGIGRGKKKWNRVQKRWGEEKIIIWNGVKKEVTDKYGDVIMT